MKTPSSRDNREGKSRLDALREGRDPDAFKTEPLAVDSRITAHFSGKAVRENFQAIQRLVPGLFLLPMVKANAYGHGAAFVSKILLAERNLYGLGVATFDEALELRRALGAKARKSRIFIFSGSTPWSEEKAQLCEQEGLTPVLSTEEDWRKFLKAGCPERVSYELKFNTGMNRLGIDVGYARQIQKDLKEKPPEWQPGGVASHLAIGEEPDHPLSRLQRERFVLLRRELGAAFPGARFHLGNSAAIWQSKLWRLEEISDIARPGLSLYGVPPYPGAPKRDLEAVMQLSVSVVQTRVLKPGESLGYGATFRVTQEMGPTKIAILAGGYADGIHRTLSSTGFGFWNGDRVKFLGRVSMDLSAVSCPEGLKAGDSVEILGPHIDPWNQSGAAQTIPYELLTSVSPRVKRIYS